VNTKALLEKFYRETPLEKIPWNKAQADFFMKLLKANKLGEGKALDLGCGVGAKSIALAKKGFKVTGIDIAPTAIKYAREKAKKAGVKVRFIAADATDLSFLGEEKFDFILDWANLHGIPKTKRRKYVREIAKHCKKGGKFLLRCWSKDGISKMMYLKFYLSTRASLLNFLARGLQENGSMNI
jgi:2-polyprenyl-3-methyl-5-hydroxy-6-metoxy-1,4-benzoquinol methylase